LSKADDYLEGVFKDAYKRELDADENVARTLPFFAASLALGATLFSYVLPRMPTLTFGLYSVLMHSLLVAAGTLLVLILWWLLQAVRVREYRLPPRETDQLEWAAALVGHFESTGLKADAVDKQVEEVVRAAMLREYAAAAVHNRNANKPKLQARALGFTYLVALLAVAFLMIGIIFVTDRVAGPATEEQPHGRAEAPVEQRPVRETVGDAEGARIPSSSGGGQNSRLTGSQHSGALNGVKEVSSNTNSQPGNAPAQQPTPTPTTSGPPAAPPHQLLKKSITDPPERR
jgi:hypothetical protein